MKNKRILKLLSLSLALCMLFAAASCKKKEVPGEDTQSHDSEANTSSLDIELESLEPENVNPLTGLEASCDVSDRRPLAIMLNNIQEALPQVGISEADVLFECIAEGGITRLMGVFADYDGLGVIGSVRSSRPYYIDFAQMFDAIYCHAGGSEDAYSELASRGIDHIDGVRGDPLGVFYRDSERMQTMSYEHTLMTTGEGLIKTVEACSFRTELRDGHNYPWAFPAWNESATLGERTVSKVHLPISNYQTVDYEYDETSNKYLRFQYSGMPHVDGGTGEQLSFTNIVIMFCDQWAYDDYGRMKVTTIGEGSGWAISEGHCTEITWSRPDRESDLTLKDTLTGDKITLNRGKTVINVCPMSVQYTFTFED